MQAKGSLEFTVRLASPNHADTMELRFPAGAADRFLLQ